jgi:predicted transcriptional regulator
MRRELMTLRLDGALRSRLDLAAERRSLTASAAARVALEAWVEVEEREAGARPFDAIADLIGSVRRGPRRAR